MHWAVFRATVCDSFEWTWYHCCRGGSQWFHMLIESITSANRIHLPDEFELWSILLLLFLGLVARELCVFEFVQIWEGFVSTKALLDLVWSSLVIVVCAFWRNYLIRVILLILLMLLGMIVVELLVKLLFYFLLLLVFEGEIIPVLKDFFHLAENLVKVLERSLHRRSGISCHCCCCCWRCNWVDLKVKFIMDWAFHILDSKLLLWLRLLVWW